MKFRAKFPQNIHETFLVIRAYFKGLFELAQEIYQTRFFQMDNDEILNFSSFLDDGELSEILPFYIGVFEPKFSSTYDPTSGEEDSG